MYYRYQQQEQKNEKKTPKRCFPPKKIQRFQKQPTKIQKKSPFFHLKKKISQQKPMGKISQGKQKKHQPKITCAKKGV